MATAEKQNPTAKHPRATRRFLVLVHLWLGLTLGAVVSLTGLTGSALVFYQELDAGLNPQLVSEHPHSKPASYEAFYAFLTTLTPKGSGYWSIELPPEGGTITSRFVRNLGPGIADERRLVSIDPERLAVLRNTVWGGYAMTWLYDLHQQLLLPQAIGHMLMGVLGLLLLGLIALGFMVWWPKSGFWRDSLRLRWSASTSRNLLGIHRIAGAYFGLFLVVLAATGAMIALPHVTRPLLSQFSAIEPFPVVRSQRDEAGQRISFDRALAAAQKQYPDARAVWIDEPNGETGVYQIRMQAKAEPSPRFPRTYVWVDQYSGTILAARTTKGENFGDTVLTWLHPLHNGEAFGTAGKLVVFVLGFLPLVLFVTGLCRWLALRKEGQSRALP